MRGSLDRLAIKGHLARTWIRLRSRDISHLDPDRRARREWAIRELGHYWRSKPLPRNAYGPERTPIFEDDAGRRCAVAHLVWESGGEGIVASIHETQNLARVPEITLDELTEWASNHGLTIDELREIQPAYSRGLDPTLTAWLAAIGSLGVISGAAAVAGLVKGSRLPRSFAGVATALMLGLATILTILVLGHDSTGDRSGYFYELPLLARPMMFALWALTAALGVLWFVRWRTRSSAT